MQDRMEHNYMLFMYIVILKIYETITNICVYMQKHFR